MSQTSVWLASPLLRWTKDLNWPAHFCLLGRVQTSESQQTHTKMDVRQFVQETPRQNALGLFNLNTYGRI